MTILFFSIIHIGFTGTIFAVYTNKSAQNERAALLSNVSLAITLIILVVIMADFIRSGTSIANYGQFKEKFKKGCLCRMYMVISMIYRLGIAVLMAYNLQSAYNSTLYPIALCLAFLLYHIAHLPYSSVLHNYRSTVIHSTSLVILFTSNYYRSMQANLSLLRKAHLHGPGLLLYGCIAACFIFSAVCFIV